eukprot:TRINITY_DN12033_c0_g1_i2.p3 TRINITY_DN12033_c0_g1~~TRINITY_DN12033_c0_g1_i2.p3  ORF type:complete len:161 (+),score=32.49 TRINITY_DN12033_c0_g1_i2:248-730(+)
MARLLMAKGASLATRNKAGVTPAQAIMTPSALRKPDFEQLLLLCIEAGVCDQPAKNGVTPLMQLASCTDEASAIRWVDLLVANGADRNAGDKTSSVFSLCADREHGRRWLQQQLDQGWKPSKFQLVRAIATALRFHACTRLSNVSCVTSVCCVGLNVYVG